MSLIHGLIIPTATLTAGTVKKTMQQCTVPLIRRGWANGVWLSNRRLWNSESIGKGHACARLVGPAGMVGDIETEAALHPTSNFRGVSVGFHGTNLAGFEDVATFPCQVRQNGDRNRFDCRNRLGDRFVYSFVLHK
jgi:hypothetical protein